MESVRSFRARWGRMLIAMTTVGCLALIGIPLFVFSTVPTDEGPTYVRLPILVFFPLILFATALFSIRSFDVCQDGILVRRLFWNSRLPYQGLRSVEVDPDAMKGSIRTMGNGGLFSFSGRYRSRALGSFRALATEFRDSVILRYDTGTVVVTPESPGEFADMVRQFSGRG
jgi:hypothetical protein